MTSAGGWLIVHFVCSLCANSSEQHVQILKLVWSSPAECSTESLSWSLWLDLLICWFAEQLNFHKELWHTLLQGGGVLQHISRKRKCVCRIRAENRIKKFHVRRRAVGCFVQHTKEEKSKLNQLMLSSSCTNTLMYYTLCSTPWEEKVIHTCRIIRTNIFKLNRK